MAKTISLSVVKRDLFGRKVKQLRRQGIIPANIFGHGVDSLAIQVDKATFKKIYEEAGETNLITIKVDGESKTRPVLVSQIHEDPVTELIQHVDFRQVKLTEKISANIPIETEGESPAVKELGGVFMLNLDEIEVEALPSDLPDRFLIDLSKLEAIGDVITVADLKTSTKVEIQLEDDMVVASIQAAQTEEPEPESEEPVETETTVQSDSDSSDQE